MKGFMAAIVIGFFSLFCLDASAQRYFGYYGNDGDLIQNYDHINLHHIMWPPSDPVQATDFILRELDQSRMLGVKAMVTVDTLLFNFPNRQCPASPRRDLEATRQIWTNFVNKLTTAGHLGPNGTVVAFYLIDEPELCGLQDRYVQIENGAEGFFSIPDNQAIRDATGIIRSNPNTANIPIATISHNLMTDGGRYFDWLGIDTYGKDDQTSIGYNDFSGMLTYCHDVDPPLGVGQHLWETNCRNWSRLPKIILVPQAATGGCGLDGSPHNPQAWFTEFKRQWVGKIVLLMPFLWKTQNGGQCPGTKDLPALRNQYTQIGLQIKNGQVP
ncbi:hypothetical protein [Stenotrophomonas sp.]|uniref:hypothetical protein n=1 Tax=Stenotrophomonas sp. TaxID=69392 RepID=UPI00289E93DA|nr:hypothetical protein [Stenotrophomonas sp.]